MQTTGVFPTMVLQMCAIGEESGSLDGMLSKAAEFYVAPEDHQNYYFQNKSKNSYCRFVIEPKLKKLKLDH